MLFSVVLLLTGLLYRSGMFDVCLQKYNEYNENTVRPENQPIYKCVTGSISDAVVTTSSRWGRQIIG